MSNDKDAKSPKMREDSGDDSIPTKPTNNDGDASRATKSLSAYMDNDIDFMTAQHALQFHHIDKDRNLVMTETTNPAHKILASNLISPSRWCHEITETHTPIDSITQLWLMPFPTNGNTADLKTVC